MKRATISQPSKLQPLHNLDGLHVLMDESYEGIATIYFLEGPVISMRIKTLWLRNGW